MRRSSLTSLERPRPDLSNDMSFDPLRPSYAELEDQIETCFEKLSLARKVVEGQDLVHLKGLAETFPTIPSTCRCDLPRPRYSLETRFYLAPPIRHGRCYRVGRDVVGKISSRPFYRHVYHVSRTFLRGVITFVRQAALF